MRRIGSSQSYVRPPSRSAPESLAALPLSSTVRLRLTDWLQWSLRLRRARVGNHRLFEFKRIGGAAAKESLRRR